MGRNDIELLDQSFYLSRGRYLIDIVMAYNFLTWEMIYYNKLEKTLDWEYRWRTCLQRLF